MTATPIPRTVAMTVFGDLETSMLVAAPLGPRARSPPTWCPPRTSRTSWTRAWQRVREEVGLGRQAYVVCPRIGDQEGDEGDLADVRRRTSEDRRPPLAVLDVARACSPRGPLPGLRLEVLHGKLPPEDKDAVMRAFARGEIDVLVATTVIEVGVNVPNATVMVIMDADRFGVSQLHQLRGRVGRGGLPGPVPAGHRVPRRAPRRGRASTRWPPPWTASSCPASTWSSAARATCWARPSRARSSLKLLQLLRDEDVIASARDEATALLAADPELTAPPGPARRDRHLLDGRASRVPRKGLTAGAAGVRAGMKRAPCEHDAR